MGQKISALLVIHNEEKLIRRCLDSLKGCVDEIIVIHDGECADRSLEIARKYTDNIYTGERRGMMEYHLIDGIKKCYGDWILKIDADEYLSEDLRKNLRMLARTDEYDCFSFIWPLWDGKKYLTEKWPHKDALFRKRGLSYIEFPHKNLIPKGKTKTTRFTLHHQPDYNNYSLSTFRSKFKKWIDLHAGAFLKSKEQICTYGNPPCFNSGMISIKSRFPVLQIVMVIKTFLLDVLRLRFLDLKGFLLLYRFLFYYNIRLFIRVRQLKGQKSLINSENNER